MAVFDMEGDAVIHKSKVREIVRILIGNKFYLTLPLRERYDVIRCILKRFCYSK